MSHTPGPWTADLAGKVTLYGSHAVLAPSDTLPVAYVRSHRDVNLITAAPECYAALRGLVAPDGLSVYATTEAITAAREALAMSTQLYCDRCHHVIPPDARRRVRLLVSLSRDEHGDVDQDFCGACIDEEPWLQALEALALKAGLDQA